MSQEEDGPVYYREIQKNAYLKRIPNDEGGSKLRPLGHKKPPLKPMWTQFCIHNGRTPFLEQYPEASSPAALRHSPVWRVSLRTARHVTASVKPRAGDQYDFLVDTDHGPVRMLAPDWESMQDWVTTLRNKLSELRIVGRGENVYCAPPAPPAPAAARAAARDPTSPLPPTPPVPPDRVPGIELAPIRPTQAPPPEPELEPEPEPEPTPPEQPTESSENERQEVIDISNWDTTLDQPSTSQEQPKKNLAKICGQNICLDDSIFKRSEVTDSDEEFFAEIDRVHESIENLCFEGSSERGEGFKQRLVVNDGEGSQSVENNNGDRPSNITVIQVSNKEPPHTAIPVLGPETNVFYFDFPKPETAHPNFVNIVNTEVNVQNTNEYGTVFAKNDTEYGHLSLTTTVNLTGDKTVNNDSVYERLCLASTSAEKPSPLPVKKLKNQDKLRKSSLPNLDTVTSESNYEYLFLGNARNNVTYTQPNTVQNATGSSNPSIQTSVSTPTHSAAVQSEPTSRNIHINSVAVNNESNVQRIGSIVERSHSQNACDASPRRNVRRVQNGSPKRDVKSERQEQVQAKPIWKRGLTELSLLTRLRGIGQKRQESPTRQCQESDTSRNVTSPKVVHRSRNETRVDSTRRRSSSLSNGQSPPTRSPPHLQPLRTRQAAALRAEQRRGAALVATIPTSDPPVFAHYNKQVWVAWWGSSGVRCNGRTGDRVCALRGIPPKDAAHAKQLVHHARTHAVDILFHRVPLGKIYVVNKRDQENLGIKLDNECNITNVESGSPAGRGSLPPPGKWALTEVNNRPINLVKGGEDDMNRLSLHGTEVSLLLQPSQLVTKLRAALKGHSTLLGYR